MGDHDNDNDTIASLPAIHAGDNIGGGSGGAGGGGVGGSVEDNSMVSLNMAALNITTHSDVTPTATAPATARSLAPAGGGVAAKKPRAWKGSVGVFLTH